MPSFPLLTATPHTALLRPLSSFSHTLVPTGLDGGTNSTGFGVSNRISSVPFVTSVFSVHFSPDGQRLLTAGNDRKIKVWSTEGLEGKEEKDYLLAEIDCRPNVVNCARWTRCGSYFASGDSGGAVMLFRKTGPGVPVLGQTKVNVEDWVNCSMIATDPAHMDVQDIAWSDCGKYLAATTLANFVVVCTLSIQPVGLLLIKKLDCLQPSGICWSLTGSHLCCQKTDGLIQVWESATWNSTIVGDKIVETRQSHQPAVVFWRLDWSPNGTCLAVNRGYKAGSILSYGVILFNESFAPTHFMPASKAYTTVVKFSPCLFQNENGVNSDPPLHLVAIGCMGGRVSLWCSNNVKALAVLKDLDGAVTDIAWSPNGDAIAVSVENSCILYLRVQLHSLGLKKVDDSLVRREVGSNLKLDVALSESSPVNSIPNSVYNQQLKSQTVTKKRIQPQLVPPPDTNLAVNVATISQLPLKKKRTESSDFSQKRKVLDVKASDSNATEGSLNNGVSAEVLLQEHSMHEKNPKNSDEVHTCPFSHSHFLLPPAGLLPSNFTCFSEANLDTSCTSETQYSLHIAQREAVEDSCSDHVPKHVSTITCRLESGNFAPQSVIWQDQFNLPVLLAKCSDRFAVTVLLDQQIYVWSVYSGRRVLQGLIAPSPVSIVNLLAKKYLMIGCIKGEVIVVDLEKFSKVISCSLLPILNSDFSLALTSSRLIVHAFSSSVKLILTFSNGSEFLYCSLLEMWKVLRPFPLSFTLSKYFGFSKLPHIGTINVMQYPNHQIASLLEIQQSTLAHLEAEIEIALSLEDAEEYTRWLTFYLECLTFSFALFHLDLSQSIQSTTFPSHLYFRLQETVIFLCRLPDLENDALGTPFRFLQSIKRALLNLVVHSLASNPLLATLVHQVNGIVVGKLLY